MPQIDWNVLLSTVVYPAVFILIATVVTTVLVPWLRKQAAKTNSEFLGLLADGAVSFAEQMREQAKKTNGAAIPGHDKLKELAAGKLSADAAKNGVKVTEQEISDLIESALGKVHLNNPK